uniref:Transcriptional regulator n=1 Tax=Panagrellus redivivus TaxID=6233 RepID=A0A7E4VA68_PANRE
MKSFIEYKSEKLPYLNIPHTFKHRLINLAPIKVADKLNIAIPDIETPRTRRYKVYSSVYVTDTVQVFHLASKNVQPRINWCWFHYIVDGPFTFDPWWQSALLMDNSSGDNDIICVNNTLTLHLDNIKNYDRVIPLIAGSYSRLVLHRQCTWAQVKLLIKSNVKQVRIMNKIRVTPEEYDDVVKFIFSFCRDFDNK